MRYPCPPHARRMFSMPSAVMVDVSAFRPEKEACADLQHAARMLGMMLMIKHHEES